MKETKRRKRKRKKEKQTFNGGVSQQLLLLGLFLQLLAVAHLKPTLSRDISIFILVRCKSGKVFAKTGDVGGSSLLGREVRVRHPS